MMKTIEIYSDTRGKATCRGCGAPIEWATIVGSLKKMPFDGEIVALSIRYEDATRRLVEVVALDTNHWATCSQAGSFKRGR